MFGIFKGKSEKQKLMDKYKKLHEEAFRLSKVDRTQSDAKFAEAEELMKEIDNLPD